MNFNPGPAGFFRRLNPLQQVRYEFHLIIYMKPFPRFLSLLNRKMAKLSNHSSLAGEPVYNKDRLLYRE
jgi:hypothetical protein